MKFVSLIIVKLLISTKFFLLNIAEHENCYADKYENAYYFLELFFAFSYLFAERILCSAESSTKQKML